MITKSNGNFSWKAIICLPTSNWAVLAVPVSPMTAKRTEPSFWGRRSSWARVAAARSATAARARPSADFEPGRGLTTSPRDRRVRDDVGDEVQDHVGFGVAQDQRPAHEAVAHDLGQHRQLQQQ